MLLAGAPQEALEPAHALRPVPLGGRSCGALAGGRKKTKTRLAGTDSDYYSRHGGSRGLARGEAEARGRSPATSLKRSEAEHKNCALPPVANFYALRSVAQRTFIP